MEGYNLLCAPWSFDLNQSNTSKTLQFTLLQGRLISRGVVPMALMVFQPRSFLFLLLLLFFMILTFWTGQGKIICKEYSINMPVRIGVNIQTSLLSKRKQYAKVQFRFPCRVENNDKTHLTWQRWVLPPLWEWLPCSLTGQGSCAAGELAGWTWRSGVWHLVLGQNWGRGALRCLSQLSKVQAQSIP